MVRLDGAGADKSALDELHALIARLKAAGRGASGVDSKLIAETEKSLREATIKLVRTGYIRRISPDGVPWRGGKSGGGDLIMSGAMFASMKTEDRANGFALISRVGAVNGQLYGGTHQYGRTIRAKGYDPIRAAVKFSGQTIGRSARSRPGAIKAGWGAFGVSGSLRLKMRAVRIGGKFAYSKSAETQPMRWRTPDGKWHSAYKIRVPARPIVPRSGRLPSTWNRQFETEIRGVIRRLFASAGPGAGNVR